MNTLKTIVISLALGFTSIASAQENTEQTTPAFISDDLQVFMHSGAGNNYRIVGTVNAGAEIQLTSQEQNNYTQIIDPKGRTAWVESIHVSANPGLRNVIAEMNGKLAALTDENNQLATQLDTANASVESLTAQTESLQNEIADINQELTNTKGQLKDQDTNIKKEWFFNGAMVLGVGFILGWLLPKFGGRRRTNMDSWN